MVNRMSDNVLILGFGEIGQSVYRLYRPYKDIYNIYYKDLNTFKGYTPIEEGISIKVLQVCIPYTPMFIDCVIETVKAYGVQTVIINSTVPVGTTRAIAVATDCAIGHSPVIGIHPNLTESIQTFKKIVGTMSPNDDKAILEHFKSIGIQTVAYSNPEESEASKLFSTSYYGTIIRFMQDVHEYCDALDLDFDKVYTKTNEIYNEGYKKMGMPNVIRPILKYAGRGFGGHCVWQNAKIINDLYTLPSITNIVNEGKNDLKGGFASREQDNN